jgi:CheY-like chemotaxis protein/HPt (histidine-containing phosphotransfer) domain-containing protein/two-component sensor histidine kinase
MGIHPITVPLAPLVRSVEQLMRPLASQKGLGLHISTADDLPLWVEVDGTRLKQIILNLVTNAIKFSEQGTVSIRLGRDSTAAPSVDSSTYPLQLTVQDQGIGMNAATLARLFERFTQGDASTSRRFGGTGLGLEISRNLARRMGGDITVSSELGTGSLFTVTLPLPLSSPPQTTQTPAEASNTTEQAGARGLNILVADDQLVNRKYMGALLTSLGHHPRFAEDGAQACQEVQRKAPDLVLMDLHMPTMDGFEATRQIRQWPQFATMPIVALTADVFAETRTQASEAGMSAFLCKPVGVDAIQSVIADVLSTHIPATSTAPDPHPTDNAATSTTSPTQVTTVAQVPKRPPRRRFRSGDVASHINMAMVGEVCIGISLPGYQTLLQSYFSDESGSLDAVLAALESGDYPELRAAAHGFKGASANLGFQRLAELALELEKAEHGASPEANNNLLAAWEMTHALCLRMGLTHVPEVLERHRIDSERSAQAAVSA